jgi:glyoxylase-like metal-dependent hydrolase (beta-lactamase superfamily II)
LIKESQGDQERYILCETGIGAFFEPQMKSRFGVQEEEHVLIESLASIGVSPEQIDVIILSHLHFDHAGGLLSAWREGSPLTLAFPKATYLVGERALERARAPHARDRASFIPELMTLLDESGRLEVLKRDATSSTLGEAYRFHESDGHTPGQLLVEVFGEHGSILFCGDLIPGAPWVHLPITMGYDRFPELLIEEKSTLLSELIQRNTRLFFTHDSRYACAHIGLDQRKRYFAQDPQERLEGELL